jgi:hypothetical protein
MLKMHLLQVYDFYVNYGSSGLIQVPSSDLGCYHTSEILSENTIFKSGSDHGAKVRDPDLQQWQGYLKCGQVASVLLLQLAGIRHVEFHHKSAINIFDNHYEKRKSKQQGCKEFKKLRRMILHPLFAQKRKFSLQKFGSISLLCGMYR